MFPLMRRKGRVLVLDDDLAMQKLVRMILKREGYRVDVVGNGREAIKELNGSSFTAVLLDLMMPHEGGVTVIKHLREKSPETLKKVILLTATPESVLKDLAKEVFAVVRKPFQADELIAAVARLH